MSTIKKVVAVQKRAKRRRPTLTAVRALLSGSVADAISSLPHASTATLHSALVFERNGRKRASLIRALRAELAGRVRAGREKKDKA